MDSVLFMDLEMNDTSFVRCNLSHADFSCATCKACLFSECNLNNARFEDSILDNSDFSTALDFVIDPMKNSIKNAIFIHQNILGLVQGLPIKIL